MIKFKNSTILIAVYHRQNSVQSTRVVDNLFYSLKNICLFIDSVIKEFYSCSLYLPFFITFFKNILFNFPNIISLESTYA
jgi:hypothetical protein